MNFIERRDNIEYTLISIILIMAIIIITLFVKVNKLEDRIKIMKRNFNQVANQSEISENPVNDELRRLIKEGKDVKAVKKARENLGLSLIEGKEYIDELKLENR